MPSEYTIEFIDALKSKSKRVNHHSYQYDADAICSYLESRTSLYRKSVFSDCYWNRYPKYRTWRDHNHECNKSHAYGIQIVLKHLATNRDNYPKTYRSLLLNSNGIILNFAIESFFGKDKMKLAKRGLNSVDARVRKASARIVPIKMIESLIDDSDSGIRTIVANRISPSARPDLFLYSKNNFAKIEAIVASELSKDTVFKMIAERSEPGRIDWLGAREIVCLLQKLDNTDLLYFINLAERHTEISFHIKKRFS